MPFLRRIGRGGLLQAAARTAVIAGTATAVSGGIRRFQERDRFDEAAPAAPAASAPSPVAAEPTPQGYGQQNGHQGYGEPAPAPAPGTLPSPAQASEQRPVGTGAEGSAAGGADLMHQLEQLAALHQQGALTAEEFAAAKGKLLGL
jgi:hypothetical protein